MRETLFIGDVHGCADELQLLLQKAGHGPHMNVVFVGDLINKGPDSAGVLAIFEELGARVVLGNHEWGFVNYVRKGRTDRPDFEAVKQSLGDALPVWLRRFAAWPLYLESRGWMVVHAGLQPGFHPATTERRILITIRTWDGLGEVLEREHDPPWFELYHGAKPVVFGHWARRGLVDRPNAIGLDTGCVYGGTLTGVILPERRFVQVAAKRVYRDPAADG